MFRVGTALKRRVSISHRGGALAIQIKRHNQWKSAIWLLFWFTMAFLFFCSVLLKGLFRALSAHSAAGSLSVVAFFAFIFVWYAMAVRLGLWRAFGVEELVVDNGRLHWERTAWKWHRQFETNVSEISDVEAKTPWHALANRVEFTCSGRRHTIGDMLLQDEAHEIADELARAAGLHEHSLT
jgi:hypothetical protein